MADEFVNFDSALNELKLSAEQLKRLVSEGEIRAVRGDNDTMRFRRDEIERLKATAGGDESSDTLTDDLLFDEADDLDVEDEGMATAQISSQDTFVGDKTGMTTAPIAPKGKGPKGGRKAGGRASKPAPKSAPAPAPSQVRRTTGRSTRMRQAELEKDSSGIGMGVTAGLILGTLVSLFALLVWWDISNNSMSSPTEGIAKWAGETFGKIQPK